MLYKWSTTSVIGFFTLLLFLLGMHQLARAAQLTLTWVDNSNNEDGFGIERRIGTTGAYQPLATVAANVTTYTDISLLDGTTYCYHVFAFDSAGSSAYSPEACATTPVATQPPAANTISTNIASGAVLSGSSVIWTATPTGSPVRVEFLIDGALSWTESTAPYQYNGDPSGTLDTTTLTNGSHQLAVRAVYSDASIVSQTVTVTVSNTSIQTVTLIVAKAGSGGGTVTSSPAGINCGSTCSASFNSGALVTLTATPASGSTFTGWSGDAACTTGNVTVSANTKCTATFSMSGYMLTTTVVSQVTLSGSPSGSIVSSPAGIDCGTDCTELYPSGTLVNLTPVAGTNSRFSGWTGDSDCADGSVTMNTNKTCAANFVLDSVTLSVSKNGDGTVTSTPAGISCGATCSYSFITATTVTLKATPAAGTAFSGWNGACSGTSDCTVTLSADTTVTANFHGNLADKIGVYRPATGEWFLDRNGNGSWDGCGPDLCLQTFGGTNGVPVVGDWNGSGVAKVGLFVPGNSQWILDANGNGVWDGCNVDICINRFGQSNDVPVVGQWTKTGPDGIGVFRSAEKRWHLDLNGNDILDSCKIDKCLILKTYRTGDVPVAGDWTGIGTTQLGLFRPSTGQWFLDRNANRSWNGCRRDACFSNFGSPGDIPVIGDWSGNGKSSIGIFRPKTGEWFLDLNGNGTWDGPQLDLYVQGYGEPGDIPVVGKW